MLTPRDKRLIIHLGYHKQLSHRQMGLLEFPSSKHHLEYSYQSLQSRIRKVFLAENIFSNPLYLDLEEGKRTPIYKLDKNGRKLFELLTTEKCSYTNFNYRYTPHLLQVNDILVELKRKEIIGMNDFIIEHKTDFNVIDVLVDLKKMYLAIEVDLSESDWRKEIQKQYIDYLSISLDKSFELMYYSNRVDKLREWISEVGDEKVVPYFVERNPRLATNIIKENIICTV